MQDTCPLWSASRSVLIKTLITSTTWWYCTQSAGVLPLSASRLKVSSNLCSNTATTGSDYIYHVVVLHPECRCSSIICESFEGFFKPLLKHCHYWVCVSGSHLPISHLLREGPRVTMLLLSEGKLIDADRWLHRSGGEYGLPCQNILHP